MSFNLKYMPIRRRLMIIMMILAITVIAISTAITLFYDSYQLKKQLIQETRTVNKALSQDFAKISLLDSAELVADTISRINAFPMILNVDAYDQQGLLILHYSVDPKETHSNKLPQGLDIIFSENRLILKTPIIYQDHPIGTVFYSVSTAKISQRIQDIYQPLLYSVPASLLFSVLAAFILQRIFSRPILTLTKSIERIAHQQDFNIRLKTEPSDKSEISSLQNSFNEMLRQLQLANHSIQEQKERIQITLDSIGDGVIVTNTKSIITLMNPVACELTGWSLEDAVGKPLPEVFNIVNSKTRQPVPNPVSRVIHSGKLVGLANHTTLLTRGTAEYHIMDSAAPILDDHNVIQGVIIVFHDVSEKYQTQQKIAESEERFKLMANASPLMIWQTNSEGEYIFVNETMLEFTGLNVTELSKNWTNFIHPDDLHLITSSFHYDIPENHNERIETEYRLLSHSGEYHDVLEIGTALINTDNQFLGYIGSCFDITERKKAATRINRLAYYDSLTELPNRRLFVDRFNQALIRAKRQKLCGALLFIDLDHFKTLNDSLGHSIGDLLLKEVANRLLSFVRKADTVARLGGDEFVILSSPLHSSSNEVINHIQLFAEKILYLLRKPYVLGSYEHINTPSIGISLFSHTTKDIDECIKQADTAMYKAKSMGRNNYCFYSFTMQQTVDSRLDIEKQLRIAIKEQQFSLYYQPKVSMEGEIIGAEALIRWIKADGEFVTPDSFIPIAEETGLIIDIGDWVLQTAMAQLQHWEQQKLVTNFQLAINVSPRQFHQKNFVAQVSNLYQSYKIMSNQVTLEITEGVVIEHLNKTIEVMNQLRNRGFKISLDDFGTGFSSLAYLKKLPLDEIKIDRSFMQGIPNNNSDITIIKTICMVAESFNLKTVAEGVEEKIQLDFLAKLNCKCYQGYLFSPAVSAEKFSALLRSKK